MATARDQELKFREPTDREVMLRDILAALAGSAGWTILWLSCNTALRGAGLLPADANRRVEAIPPLLILLGASVVFSIAGFVASALASRAGYRAAIILCAIQLVLGILFQTQAWHLMPIWYHLSFLSLLVPMTLVGAWLRLK